MPKMPLLSRIKSKKNGTAKTTPSCTAFLEQRCGEMKKENPLREVHCFFSKHLYECAKTLQL
jgi:hypothetical protein